jgi:hypothetical protein
VLESKAAYAENEMRLAIASGARSIQDLVESGKNRLKIAESTFEVSIFSDPTTPDVKREGILCKREGRNTGEAFSGRNSAT